MSAQIKEALAAFSRVHPARGTVDISNGYADIEIVRSALLSAQQEADAWEAIEALCLLRGYTYIGGLRSTGNMPHVFGMWNSERCLFHVVASTRLEALTKAAEWCRAEMAR